MPFKNKEDKNKSSRESYRRHKQKISNKRKEDRQKNNEATNAYHRAYYARNREKCLNSNAKWRKRYPDKYAAYLERTRLKRHGITKDQFDSLLAAQNGRCAICGCEDDMVIDHCHDTGAVRGLLCQSCNKALGFVQDNLDILNNAIKYLGITYLSPLEIEK